jgi:hypothetical protein
MAEHDDDRVKPSEQRGGTNPGEAELRAKGEWVENAAEGIVPAELGGSDAPDSPLHDDPEYSDAALGRTTGSDAPATQAGIDPAAGDDADAVTDGGQKRPAGAEPDLKDAAAGPRPVDADSAR